nr:hypothetical protein [Tanacetum cinerariifolium]
MSQQNTPRNTKRYHNSPFVASKQHNVGGSSSQPNMNCPSSPINLFGGENAVRIIHGPAGILQAAKLRKTTEIREGGYDYEIPTQEYVREIVEDTSKDNHFTRGPWLSTVQYLAAEGGIIIVCFGDMKTFGRMGNLKNL